MAKNRITSPKDVLNRLSIPLRHLPFVFLDAIIIALMLFAAITARIPGYNWAQFFENDSSRAIGLIIYFCVAAVSQVLIFYIFGVYRIVTKNLSVLDCAKMMLLICFTQALVFVLFLIINYNRYTSIGILTFLLAVFASCLIIPGLRLSNYFLKFFGLRTDRLKYARTMVIGAGSAAKLLIDESFRNKHARNNIVVIADDDQNKIGGTLSGVPIKGPLSNMPTIIDYFQVEEVVIAIASLSDERLHQILEYLESCPVRVKRMPLISEMEGPNDTKIINVDITEMLSRDQIHLDNSEIKNMLHGKTVMVTGAGGSIGSELVRQIFAVHPAKLILFDIYENSTYDIQQDLRRRIANEKIDDIELITLIGSTYNYERMEQIFKKYSPDYIYHAAAYKHVPLMEDSPMEAIRTNVIGTYNVASLANKYGVKKMLLVSTDKAVRPTNVMGATKRFAETIVQYFQSKSKNTNYCCVRFGNVLGSNGSVIPLFKKQIEEGGPVTVTDPEITRFFMTIPEAVGLILQSSLFAAGGEIFILDMGKPTKIVSLAEKMIRQAGLIPYKDIEIKFTGLRPGEKLYEEILIDAKVHKKTSNRKIFVEDVKEIFPIEDEIKQISEVFHLDDNEEIKSMLKQIITTYHSPEEVNKRK